MLKNDLLLRAARRERTERTPVWLMRQAGRTDPAYCALRERADLPLEEMFRDPDLAAEASLLPKRIGVDAIIFFQDILTPLAPMGAEFLFRPGPQLKTPIRSTADADGLSRFDPASELNFVAQTLRIVRQTLDGDLPLLGFAGAPLTLAFFLVEGKSPGTNPDSTRAFMRDDPAGFHLLLDKLTDMTIDYLALQIEAGVDAVQLFESLADRLTPSEYETFARPYQSRIFSELGGRVPTILFAKGLPLLELMVSSGADVLSVGACVDLEEARQRFGHRLAFQGNVDNETLASGSFDEIDEAVRRCLHAGGNQGHILNLNHGLLAGTPFVNVCRFVEAAKRTLGQPDTPAATTVAATLRGGG